jgi:hypothetical protein
MVVLETDGRGVAVQSYGAKYAGKDTEGHVVMVEAGITAGADNDGTMGSVPK